MTMPSPVRMLLIAAAMFAIFAIAGCASEQSRTSAPTPPTTQSSVASTTEAATEPTTEATMEATSGPTSEPSTQASTQPTTRRSGGPSIASARAAYWLRQPAIFTIQANDFESLWKSCEASARHFGFIVDRTDYRGGVITTQPLTSKQFWEFWRNDVATLEDLANSSLATYRRTLRFDIDKLEGGGYAASPRVVIERFARTESPITASVFLRNAFRSTRGGRIYGTRETDRGVYLPRQYWYATGRDEALEKNVASELRKQLAKAQHDKSG